VARQGGSHGLLLVRFSNQLGPAMPPLPFALVRFSNWPSWLIPGANRVGWRDQPSKGKALPRNCVISPWSESTFALLCPRAPAERPVGRCLRSSLHSFEDSSASTGWRHLAHADSKAAPFGQPSAPGARPHERYGSSWRSGAAARPGRRAVRRWPTGQAEF
jgi:hypothetical protein